MRLPRVILLLLLLTSIALAAGCTGKGKRLKVGDPAPLFSASAVNGKTISLASLKGRPVVLRFFEPDCRYCKADTAVFSKYYQQYHDKGLEIIYIDVSPDTNLVKSFIKELHIPFPVIQDMKGKIAAEYLVKVVPQAIVLSPDLKIEGAMMGGVSEAELKDLLAKYIH